MAVNLEKLKLQLMKHEGCKLTPYLCPTKKWTVGIGRNLEDVGISKSEARELEYPYTAGKVLRRPDGAFLNGYPVGELPNLSVYCVNVLFENDVDDRLAKLGTMPWFVQLDDVRQRVCLDMAFQMGFGGFMSFKQTIKAIKAGDWNMARMNMLESRWSGQTPARAKRLAKMMLTGEDPDWAAVKF